MADFENQDGESHRMSLRDALVNAVDQHRDTADNVGAGDSVRSSPESGSAAAATAEETAQRARDQAGRFAKTEQKPAQAAPTQTGAPPQPAGLPEQQASSAPAISAPPSSWKKDYHEAFSKLDPSLQNYIAQREREYTTGVSVYRQEAERAKSLHTALEPFMPNMQRYNVDPAAWIGTVGRVHETLLAGSPQQKLQTIVGLARDYNVDLSPLLGQQPQGDGQQQQPGQLNPEVAWLRDQVQQLSGQLNSFTQTHQQQQQSVIQNEIQQFAADTEKYPHFEALRQPMAQLLESGLAQDLKSAYDKALRMDDKLWQASQAEQQRQAEAERQRTAANAAATARSKVVSVKSATPSGIAATTSTAKDRRTQLAEAFATQNGGRV